MNDYSSIFVILMGLGTVFFGLICLIVLTTLMGRVLSASPAPVPVSAGRGAAPVPAAPAIPEPNRQEMAAAVSAAIAEDLGIDITGLRILSMRRL